MQPKGEAVAGPHTPEHHPDAREIRIADAISHKTEILASLDLGGYVEVVFVDVGEKGLHVHKGTIAGDICDISPRRPLPHGGPGEEHEEKYRQSKQHFGMPELTARRF